MSNSHPSLTLCKFVFGETTPQRKNATDFMFKYEILITAMLGLWYFNVYFALNVFCFTVPYCSKSTDES